MTQFFRSIGTPVGQGDVTNISGSSKEPSSVPSIGRLSLSQPVLPVNATPPTRLSTISMAFVASRPTAKASVSADMSTGNISASLGKPPRAPLWKTLEENKELRQELAFLKVCGRSHCVTLCASTALVARRLPLIFQRELSSEKYKVAELTGLQSRDVQDILEEVS